MRSRVVLACSIFALTGCSTSGSGDRGNAASSTTTLVQAVDGKPFVVESLGLTFVLPNTFDSVDDADYLFLAQSMTSRSLFTIDADASAVTQVAARPGESLSNLQLDGVDAVIVTDAAIEGLPPGISSNELLVSNGASSFSVIMSGATEDLPELWDVFVRSVAVTPAG